MNKQEAITRKGVTVREASPGLDYEKIAQRAYEIYVGRGGTHGSDVEDWLQAERELLEDRKDSALLRSMAIR